LPRPKADKPLGRHLQACRAGSGTGINTDSSLQTHSASQRMSTKLTALCPAAAIKIQHSSASLSKPKPQCGLAQLLDSKDHVEYTLSLATWPSGS